jgi:acetyl-CoA carboxylase carboxyltransferase component
MSEGDPEVREDLAELLRRRKLTEHAARPEAIDRPHAQSGRTARENMEDLVDPGRSSSTAALRSRPSARAASCGS